MQPSSTSPTGPKRVEPTRDMKPMPRLAEIALREIQARAEARTQAAVDEANIATAEVMKEAMQLLGIDPKDGWVPNRESGGFIKETPAREQVAGPADSPVTRG